jgi:hypothetical protein
MLCVCGGAIWKVHTLRCISTMCHIPISMRNQIYLDGKHTGLDFPQRFGIIKWEYRKGASNVVDSDALSHLRIMRECLALLLCCEQLSVVDTANAVAAEN